MMITHEIIIIVFPVAVNDPFIGSDYMVIFVYLIFHFFYLLRRVYAIWFTEATCLCRCLYMG
jgi:hypothetical protein